MTAGNWSTAGGTDSRRRSPATLVLDSGAPTPGPGCDSLYLIGDCDWCTDHICHAWYVY